MENNILEDICEYSHVLTWLLDLIISPAKKKKPVY